MPIVTLPTQWFRYRTVTVIEHSSGLFGVCKAQEKASLINEGFNLTSGWCGLSLSSLLCVTCGVIGIADIFFQHPFIVIGELKFDTNASQLADRSLSFSFTILADASSDLCMLVTTSERRAGFLNE